MLLTYRDELLEPGLVTVDGEAAGEPEVLLNPGSVDAGREGRMIPNWSPDGRRILFWEAAEASTAVDVVVDDSDTLTITVTYRQFSDEGEWILDGTDTISNTGGPAGSMTYGADITVGGDHTGYLRADGPGRCHDRLRRQHRERGRRPGGAARPRLRLGRSDRRASDQILARLTT